MSIILSGRVLLDALANPVLPASASEAALVATSEGQTARLLYGFGPSVTQAGLRRYRSHHSVTAARRARDGAGKELHRQVQSHAPGFLIVSRMRKT